MMQNDRVKPEVGMPCLTCYWTDRYPCTIVASSSNGKRLLVKENFYNVEDHYGEEYTSKGVNYESETEIYTLRKNGRWVLEVSPMSTGRGLALNSSAMRIDPSF